MCTEPALDNAPISSKRAPTTILPDPTATGYPNRSSAAAVGCVREVIKVPLRS